MKSATAADAVAAIRDGSNVILPHVCVEPSAFYTAFGEQVDRFRDLTLYSGLQFGDYSYLSNGLGTNFRYVTWQAGPRLRPFFHEGKVSFVPIGYRDVVRVVRRGGPIEPDVVVIQASPPDASGNVNLGILVSHFQDIVRDAALVIAEINPRMPRTAGDTLVSTDAIDLAIESDAPLGTYGSSRATERDEQIVEHILDLISGGATVQFGVGAIPDLVLGRLAEKRDANIHSGMVSPGLIDFVERARHTPKIVVAEIAGDQELFDFCGRTPLVEVHRSSVTHDVVRIAGIPRFTSVNSAVEVDLQGQSNGETIGAVQISGPGGSLDFVMGAALSDGGMSIIAMPSTTEDGKHSKIVARLAEGAPVTTPRFCTDYVVTEYGAARLRGKTLEQRAEALVAIAHPDFRDALAKALS